MTIHAKAPAHRLRAMAGRDPHESHRVATPLELLYDLTFVVAFSVAANELAHSLSSGHIGAGLAGFGFATFAICWAWVNFSWFASAYDTDDWAYRVLTMGQMAGVIILALGIPQMYASIAKGEHVDNQVMVAGYVVIRAAMIVQWLRAAQQNPERRSACLTYALTIGVAQLLWVGVIIIHTSVPVTFVLVLLVTAVEMIGPLIAETLQGGTPWHPHHIAERYGLLAIIALGEGIAGTVASLSAVVGAQGWSTDAVLVIIAGVGLTFGMWWIYFVLPFGDLLHAHRSRAIPFALVHIGIFASIIATGAGLHIAAYYIEHHTELGSLATVLTVAIPVAAYIGIVYLLGAILVRLWDPFHILLVVLTAMVLGAAVWLAAGGVPMAVCLVILTGAPLVTVAGFEVIGHRHASQAIAASISRGAPADGR